MFVEFIKYHLSVKVRLKLKGCFKLYIVVIFSCLMCILLAWFISLESKLHFSY